MIIALYHAPLRIGVLAGGAVVSFVAAATAGASDANTSAIIVALIGAVGLVCAAGVGIWLKRRGGTNEIAAATVYADLQKATGELATARNALRDATERLFEAREEIDRLTERLRYAERRADRYEARVRDLEERMP